MAANGQMRQGMGAYPMQGMAPGMMPMHFMGGKGGGLANRNMPAMVPGAPGPWQGGQRGGKGMMPPGGNYVAPMKQDNNEFSTMAPGEAKTMKGYNNQPISGEAQTRMRHYEEVMARPQGTFPNAYSSDRGGKGKGKGKGKGGKGEKGEKGAGPAAFMGLGMRGQAAPGAEADKDCHFFNAGKCRNGDGCKWEHSADGARKGATTVSFGPSKGGKGKGKGKGNSQPFDLAAARGAAPTPQAPPAEPQQPAPES